MKYKKKAGLAYTDQKYAVIASRLMKVRVFMADELCDQVKPWQKVPEVSHDGVLAIKKKELPMVVQVRRQERERVDK